MKIAAAGIATPKICSAPKKPATQIPNALRSWKIQMAMSPVETLRARCSGQASLPGNA